MSTELHISLPLPEPLALIDATVLFVIQLLLAQHPELLAAPDEPHASHRRPIAHAYLLLNAARELHYALEVYRAYLPRPDDDDIPF
jgi:hypothetical protein